MRDYGVAEYKTINRFVEAKIKKFGQSEKSFEAYFELMFSEKENIMYERSTGYRMIKTTYGEAYKNILSMSYTLNTLFDGIEKNSVIGLCMDNCLEWIEIFWAIIVSGYRPLLINLRLGDSILNKALADCNAAAVISDGREFNINTVDARNVMVSDNTYKAKKFGDELFVMSSGTSEHIKICAYTAEEFYYQILDSYNIISECKLMKSSYKGMIKQLTLLPFYHIFGLSAVYMWFAFFSRTFVHLNDMSAQTVKNTIKRHKVTHIFAVPLFWEKVYEQAIKTIKARGDKTYNKFLKGMKLAKKTADIPVIGKLFINKAFKEIRDNMFGDSIRFLISGGSIIKPEVLEFFNLTGYHLVNGYGMTEVGITSVELSKKIKVCCKGYIGKPLSSVSYKINENGRLVISGKTAAKYTITDGKRYDRGEMFDTGDMAQCVNGCYTLLGRSDDVIISSDGENINPNIIESQFDIKNVNGVCLIGAKQNGSTSPVLLVSVGAFISKEKLERVDSDIREKIKELKLSTQIKKIEYIAGGFIGEGEFKLNRRRLESDYSNGKLKSVNAVDNSAELNDADTKAVLKLFCAALGKDEKDIGIDSNFFLDEGGTSLDYFAMVSKIQSEYPVTFPRTFEDSPVTVREICEYIKKNVD